MTMLTEHLQRYFGFDTFKQGQEDVIQNVLNHHSAAAIFPTGAGKSLCYQLPAMLLPNMTLVVSPLLSLMKDQIDFLQDHNIPAARLDSTLSRDEYANILDRAKQGTLKILMISVERFKNERFRHHLERMAVSLMVVDEAHCISEWGHNFRPDYLKLPEYKQEFDIPQVLLLTATATEQVIDDMCRKFAIQREHVTVTGFYRKNLFLQVSPTREDDKNDHLLQRIQEAPHDPTIVYVTLQKTAEHVSEFLSRQGINASPYHAGLKNEEREDIQNRFMVGTLDCVAATIAFGMGIDKRDIRRVIHYDLPKSIENYSQEIGRSGRDDQPSLCEVLANRDSLNVLENFIYGDTPEKASIRALLETLKHNDGFVWETKMTTLSRELNIRVLPLKTLLVYLDMEGIIRPKLTYFEEYAFKYRAEPSFIVNQFQGERHEFVSTLLGHCQTRKTWTYVDMSGMIVRYNTDRHRIIAALEYFEENNWLELEAKQAVDVYDILTQAFDLEQVSESMFSLFHTKEAHEIQRIQNMLAFFESESCLSKRLAAYFGEHLTLDACGHCSVCRQGKATIEQTHARPPLDEMDFTDLTHDFVRAVDRHASVSNVTKFLCGIYTPVFATRKVKGLRHFGALERYPFPDVKGWVTSHLPKIHIDDFPAG